ncbi:MAG: hypothetical protein HQ511_01085 [Rhodospirillales bacterium]|nr:hypothetical protein [Rhodospirillales bacterium]
MTSRKMYQYAALAGVGFGVPSIIYFAMLPQPLYALHLAVFLSGIAGVYLGFSVLDGRPRTIVMETVVMVMFFALAILGLKFSLWILAFGYFAHGVWDCLHHPKLITTKIAAWYPPFCAVYDWTVATFIVVYMSL